MRDRIGYLHEKLINHVYKFLNFKYIIDPFL